MRNKVKILQVIGALNVGGSETMLLNILKVIDKNKFEFYFLCYSDKKFEYEDEIKQMGGKIVRVKKKGLFNFVRQIMKVIKTNKIDVVHCHTYYNSVYAIIAAKMSGIRVIISHSHNTRPCKKISVARKIYYKISGKIIKKYSTHLVACGVEAGKAFYGNNSRFSVFDNGIILDDFRFSMHKRRKLREKLGIDEDTIVVGHIGRFSEQKNHKFLIDVFDEYQKNNKNSRLLLFGSGKLMNDIKKNVEDKKISEKVMFLGVKKDVKDYYNVFDIFLLPSWYEGLPVVLVEAQTNGLKIIASDIIDKSVNVCKQIMFLPLDSAREWASNIPVTIPKRYNNFEKMVNGKYDLACNIKYLENIYDMVNIANKNKKGRK